MKFYFGGEKNDIFVKTKCFPVCTKRFIDIVAKIKAVNSFQWPLLKLFVTSIMDQKNLENTFCSSASPCQRNFKKTKYLSSFCHLNRKQRALK